MYVLNIFLLLAFVESAFFSLIFSFSPSWMFQFLYNDVPVHPSELWIQSLASLLQNFIITFSHTVYHNRNICSFTSDRSANTRFIIVYSLADK